MQRVFSAFKAIPPLALIALAGVLILGGMALGSVAVSEVTIQRTGHVDRPLGLHLSVTPEADQQIDLTEDDEAAYLVYIVTNTGQTDFTNVAIAPTSYTVGMTALVDKENFALAVGASENVTLSLIFTDPTVAAGDYSLSIEGTGVGLTDVTFQRNGHVDRPIKLQLSVTPELSQHIVLAEDAEEGSIVYTIRNQGFVDFANVAITTTYTNGMETTVDKNNFPLAMGTNETVTVTFHFTDPALTGGDYWIDVVAT